MKVSDFGVNYEVSDFLLSTFQISFQFFLVSSSKLYNSRANIFSFSYKKKQIDRDQQEFDFAPGICVVITEVRKAGGKSFMRNMKYAFTFLEMIIINIIDYFRRQSFFLRTSRGTLLNLLHCSTRSKVEFSNQVSMFSFLVKIADSRCTFVSIRNCD